MAYEGPDNYISADELAEVLGISAGRVRQLTRGEGGMPRHGRGEYGLRACVQWYVEFWRAKAVGAGQGASLEESRRRKLAAEAGLRETKLLEQRRELIPAEEVSDMLETIFVPFKTALVNLGTKLAARCEGRTKAEIKEELDEEVRNVLEQLAGTALELKKGQAARKPTPRA